MSNGLNPIAAYKALPRWAQTLVAGVAVATLGVWAYGEFWQPVIDPDDLPMPLEERMQVSEIASHAFDEPCNEMLLNGVGEVEHYCEDDCLLSYHLWEGKEYPRVTIHPKRLKELAVEHAGLFSGPKCSGGCLPPTEHPGRFRQDKVADADNECVVVVWRKWFDGPGGEIGCTQYQRQNVCDGYWIDKEPKWDCCVH